MKKKYVVTGGAGFIGSNLVDELIFKGNEVVVLDNLSTGLEENINSCADLCHVDVSSCGDDFPLVRRRVMDAVSGADAFFHMAALARVQPSIESPGVFNKANVDGTLNMLTLCRDAGIKRFVYSASSSAYGNADIIPTPETAPTDPLSPYGVQKQIGEQYCRVFHHCYGMETVSLRYFNVFGERQPLSGAYCLVMGFFAQQRLNGEEMTINGDGEQRRDFTYVGDVVNANVLAATSDKVGKGEVINIGSGDNRSVNQLADLIGGPRVYRDPVIEPRETLADNSKAKELLGWEPSMTLEEWIPKYKRDLGL